MLRYIRHQPICWWIENDNQRSRCCHSDHKSLLSWDSYKSEKKKNMFCVSCHFKSKATQSHPIQIQLYKENTQGIPGNMKNISIWVVCNEVNIFVSFICCHGTKQNFIQWIVSQFTWEADWHPAYFFCLNWKQNQHQFQPSPPLKAFNWPPCLNVAELSSFLNVNFFTGSSRLAHRNATNSKFCTLGQRHTVFHEHVLCSESQRNCLICRVNWCEQSEGVVYRLS